MIPEDTIDETPDTEVANDDDAVLDEAIEAVAESLDQGSPSEVAPPVEEAAQEAAENGESAEPAAAEQPLASTDEVVAEVAPVTAAVVAESPVRTEVVEDVPPKRRSPIAWWPFILYGILWAGLLAASYVLLTGAQSEMPAFRQDAYPYLVLGGLVLTLLGPVLSLATWLLAWFRQGKGGRGGLLTTALVRGALLTFLGVALWWGMLVLVDALRLGLV